MKSLCFRILEIVVILELLDRKNIKMFLICILNNSDIEEVFGWLIDEFEVKKDVFLRYIIFVEFIIDVFKIYLICWKWIGIDKSEIYEMFYSKIVEGKKE